MIKSSVNFKQMNPDISVKSCSRKQFDDVASISYIDGYDKQCVSMHHIYVKLQDTMSDKLRCSVKTEDVLNINLIRKVNKSSNTAHFYHLLHRSRKIVRTRFEKKLIQLC